MRTTVVFGFLLRQLRVGILVIGAASCSVQEAPGDDRAATTHNAGEATGSASPSQGFDPARCAAVTDWEGCMRGQERDLIASSPDVERHGDTLVISTQTGVPVLLVDSLDRHGVGWEYFYSGQLPQGDVHLVMLRLYEGGGFVLVSRATGRVTGIDALPLLSPAGDRFVTASADTEAGYNPNRVQLFRFDADSVILEWQIEPEAWGPEDPRWIDDATVEILRRPAVLNPDTAALRAPLVLRREGATWVADSVAQGV